MPDQSTVLSPLQQSLVSVTAGVADLERQRQADLITIDELTQQVVELRARVENYEDLIADLRGELQTLGG